jgi:hypothetical protein
MGTGMGTGMEMGIGMGTGMAEKNALLKIYCVKLLLFGILQEVFL